MPPPRLNESQAHLLPVTNTPQPVHGYIPHLQSHVPMRPTTGLTERSNSDVSLPMMSPMPQTPKTPMTRESTFAAKPAKPSGPITPVDIPDAYYTHTPKPSYIGGIPKGHSPLPSYPSSNGAVLTRVGQCLRTSFFGFAQFSLQRFLL